MGRYKAAHPNNASLSEWHTHTYEWNCEMSCSHHKNVIKMLISQHSTIFTMHKYLHTQTHAYTYILTA